MPSDTTTAPDEVIDLCRDLIRIDTTNPGVGERKAAEYVAGALEEVGLETTVLESEPGRTSVVARIEGADRSRPAMLIHGHLDVVPAQAADWSVDPFSGEIRDGYLWGRGAVDMKDMVAMTLAIARDLGRHGVRPPRDLVLAFVADEEAGGRKGARFLVDTHPDLFEGVTEGIGEVGGFSYTVRDDLRLYPIETAEKGMRWLKLSVTGRAGHGSMLNDDNAVTELAEAVARIGRYRFPVRLTPTVSAFLAEVARVTDGEVSVDDPEACVARLGGLSRMLGAVLRHTVNPTQLDAGYKVNVIPGEASAHVDGRFLPGLEDEFEQELTRILGPRVRQEVVHGDIALETSFDGDLVDAMCAAIRAEDPQGVPVPYMLSGGTDAKSFSRLGIRCFGFSPLRLPPDLDFAALFHGVDERVSTDALVFGARTLRRFLDSC